MNMEFKPTPLTTDRPLTGDDIEAWRMQHGLSMDDAAYALGIANYKKKASSPEVIEYALELLMRLYDESPKHGVWPLDRITMQYLFESMYGAQLAVFTGTEHAVTARVDLQTRFAKLLGRSKGRAYRWLDRNEIDASINNRTQESVQSILGKLSQLKSPGATLERLGALIWRLRGEDIDTLHPIPTLKHPPRREKRGRRPGSTVKAVGSVRRVISPTINIKNPVKITDVTRLTKTPPLKRTKRKAK